MGVRATASEGDIYRIGLLKDKIGAQFAIGTLKDGSHVLVGYNTIHTDEIILPPDGVVNDKDVQLVKEFTKLTGSELFQCGLSIPGMAALFEDDGETYPNIVQNMIDAEGAGEEEDRYLFLGCEILAVQPGQLLVRWYADSEDKGTKLWIPFKYIEVIEAFEEEDDDDEDEEKEEKATPMKTAAL